MAGEDGKHPVAPHRTSGRTELNCGASVWCLPSTGESNCLVWDQLTHAGRPEVLCELQKGSNLSLLFRWSSALQPQRDPNSVLCTAAGAGCHLLLPCLLPRTATSLSFSLKKGRPQPDS